MSLCRYLIVVAALVALLSACSAAPRPFRALSEDDKYSNPLLEQKDRRGINIHLSNMEKNAPLTIALIEAFELSNIPATTNADLLNGHRLFGQIFAEDEQIKLVWSLSSSFGQGLGEGVALVPANMAKELEDRQLADQTVSEIARLLKPETMEALGVVDEKASVAIVDIKGAPGDGNKALRNALQVMLKNANIPVVKDPALAVLHVHSKVKLSRFSDGRESIRIDWDFKRANGYELGTITQENEIAPGSLSNKWGDAAFDVAIAMVATVSDALKLAKDNNISSAN